MQPEFMQIANAVEAAGYGERGDVVKHYASLLGVSTKTLYRRISAHADSGRKRRSDAGDSQVSDDVIKLLAAMMLNSVRGNGKQTMDIPTARQILETQGYEIPVSNSRLSVLLNERGFNLSQMKAPSPCVRMRSFHPNHVHQVDPSLCLLYYTPDGEQRIIRDSEVYKNKPFMEGKTSLKLWRYVLVDHYSGTICHRYYQTAGENCLTLWEFLLFAWGIKDDRRNIFHGLPKILIWDKGSANTSKAIANACRSLRVKTIPHATENPRAKGAVENANNLVETLFESRLKTQPVGSVDELNEYAAVWDYLFNANLLKHYDARLSRAKLARTDLWQRIGKDELVELPDGAETLLVKNAEQRTVKSDLTVSFVHPRLMGSSSYSLANLPGARPGLEVSVQPIMVSSDGKVLVSYMHDGQQVEDELLPLATDDAGFRLDAPVFGESFKRNPDTDTDRNRKSLVLLIGDDRKPFVETAGEAGIGSLDALKGDGENLMYLPPQGVKLQHPKPSKRLSITEASQRIRGNLGWFDAWCRGYLVENYPDGILEDDIEAICDRFVTMKEDSACTG